MSVDYQYFRQTKSNPDQSSFSIAVKLSPRAQHKKTALVKKMAKCHLWYFFTLDLVPRSTKVQYFTVICIWQDCVGTEEMHNINVLQGSVLGPLHFNIYNPLYNFFSSVSGQHPLSVSTENCPSLFLQSQKPWCYTVKLRVLLYRLSLGLDIYYISGTCHFSPLQNLVSPRMLKRRPTPSTANKNQRKFSACPEKPKDTELFLIKYLLTLLY